MGSAVDAAFGCLKPLTKKLEEKFTKTFGSSPLKLLNAIQKSAVQLSFLTGPQVGGVLGYAPVTTPMEPIQAGIELRTEDLSSLTVAITPTSTVGAGPSLFSSLIVAAD